MGPKLLLGIQHVGRCLRCKHGHFTSTTTANNAAMAAGSTLYLHTATEQSVSFVSCGKDRRKQNNEMPGSTVWPGVQAWAEQRCVCIQHRLHPDDRGYITMIVHVSTCRNACLKKEDIYFVLSACRALRYSHLPVAADP